MYLIPRGLDKERAPCFCGLESDFNYKYRTSRWIFWPIWLKKIALIMNCMSYLYIYIHMLDTHKETKTWAEDLNRHFSEEEIQVANRHVKRCSASAIIREMQIITTVRYHLTPVRMAIIKKHTYSKC